jgi:hypothetical protein
MASSDSIGYVTHQSVQGDTQVNLGTIGLPQKLMEDDYYDGYFIPKGTIVMGNAWFVLSPDFFQ